MRRLVVRGVMGGLVWVGGSGRRCHAWGPVMRSLVAVAGGGIRGGVCRRGYRRQLAGAGCRVLRPWPGLGGGGGGGGGVGVALLVVGGGWGLVLCWLGVWASLWVVWVLRVCAVQPLRFLTGCGAGVWVGGGRMSVRVGLWSVCNGWLLVDGARWYGHVGGGAAGGGGVGGAGVGVVLAGGPGVPVGHVGAACVRRAALAVLDWLWCRHVGGRRPHERPGGAVVRM